MKDFATESIFLPPEPELIAFPVRSKVLSRVFGWVYQLLLWAILILGVVHTVHQRVPPGDADAMNPRAAASRGLDFLGSLLMR